LQVEHISTTDMRACRAMRVARGLQLRFALKSDAFAIFEGFSADDISKVGG
jgi:hypothetical protein